MWNVPTIAAEDIIRNAHDSCGRKFYNIKLDKGQAENKRSRIMRNIDFYRIKFKSLAHVLIENDIKNYSISKNRIYIRPLKLYFCCVRVAHMLYDHHPITTKTKENCFEVVHCLLMLVQYIREWTHNSRDKRIRSFEQFGMCLHQHSCNYIR